MANHSRGSDQPPHKQLISWFLVQPERLKSAKNLLKQVIFTNLPAHDQPEDNHGSKTSTGQPRASPEAPSRVILSRSD